MQNMKKNLLKTISFLLLLLPLVISVTLIIYPKKADIYILKEQFNTQQVARNTTLNIFSQISAPTIAGITTEQGAPETMEHISKEILKDHKNKYGIVDLEGDKTILEIPSANVYGPVVDGENANAMDRGFWHYPISKPPGWRGNTIIIGHRFLHIPPRTDTLFNLDQVQIGDRIIIEQKYDKYTYTVIHTFVVDKNNTSVLEDTNDYRLTIITCTPLWSSEKRLVIIGKMDRVYGNI